MQITNPIIIVSAGRSGSTLLHEILSRNLSIAWLSGFCNRYPDKPHFNRFIMKLIDTPFFGSTLKKRFHPSEAYRFWEYYAPGFRHTYRDLYASDLTLGTKENVLAVMSQFVTTNRQRLLLKITGWPRIHYLTAIFPDAKYIHLVRDGRAVANSLLKVDFWWGWRGPDNWRLGPLPLAYQEEWEFFNHSYVALAGIGWKIILDSIEKAQESLSKNQFLQIRYEDLCTEPILSFQRMLEFCELNWTESFNIEINNYSFQNKNFYWKNNLTEAQQDILSEVTLSHRLKYDYLDV